MNCFCTGTRGKDIKLKRRTVRKHSQWSKKYFRKLLPKQKELKKSSSHQFAHNSRSRSQKPGDPRDEEVDFYLCSVTFVLHDTCLCLITRLASPLLIYDRE